MRTNQCGAKVGNMTQPTEENPSEQPYDPDEDVDTLPSDQSPADGHPSQAEGEDDSSALPSSSE